METLAPPPAPGSFSGLSSEDPSQWTVDEVIQYISASDSGLNIHGELFRKHVSQFQKILKLFCRMPHCVHRALLIHQSPYLCVSVRVCVCDFIILTTDFRKQIFGAKCSPITSRPKVGYSSLSL